MFGVVYADPPWTYRDKAGAGNRGAGHQYPLLTVAQLQAMPVAELAQPDSALLLWATWPLIEDALSVGKAWGFHYKTAGFVWAKFGKRVRAPLFGVDALGKPLWGMGSYTRANTEPCLLFTRGRPKRASAGVHQLLTDSPGRHSAKPAEARRRIELLFGDVPRVELFARERAPGWSAWGLDVESDSSVSAVLGEPGTQT